MTRIFAAVAILLLLMGCGPTLVVDTDKQQQPILIRSSQPDTEDLVELHKKHKLTTIINLRGADIIEDPNVKWHIEEKRFCSSNDIIYLFMDLNDGTTPPAKEDIDLFLYIMSESSFHPVLIHCQAGIHRTGFFSALYRIQFNKWNPERAIAEMESHWFNWSISDRSAIKAFLRNYKVRDFGNE